MKKKIVLLMSMTLALSLAAGCSFSTSDKGKEKAAEATTESMDFFEDMPEEPRPEKPEEYMKLGTYKGITIKKSSSTVSDKEVDEAIQAEMTVDLVEVTDRNTVKEGDILFVSYEVSVDGEPVEEYVEDEREYHLGENEFAFLKEDIDKKLIGKKVGDQFTLKNSFVDDLADEEMIDFEDYDDYDDETDALSADDLGDAGLEDDGEEPFEEEGSEDEDAQYAGKECEITITINSIQKEEPAKLTDEYVVKYTNGEYKTVDEYRKGRKKEIEDWKKENAEQEAFHNLYVQIVNNSEQIKDFPEDMVKQEVDYLTEDIAAEMYENMDEDQEQAFDEYFKENYPEFKDIHEYAIFSLKYTCIHDLLVKEYKIDPTEAQIKEALKDVYADWGFESVEDAMDQIPKDELKEITIDNMLQDQLKKDNKIVEADGK